MKTKIVGILVVALLIITIVLPSMNGSVLKKTHSTKVENIKKTIEDQIYYSDLGYNQDFNPIKQLCEIYDINYNPEIFNDGFGNNPMAPLGFFDYLVKGYVTDESTNDPIEGAEFLLIGNGKHFGFDLYSAFTDSDGYYEIYMEQVAYAGIYFIRADDYYSQYDYQMDYYTYESWINASLEPGAPAKNSKVCGYILDAYSAEPIEGATIHMNWVDGQGHGDWPYIYSDSSGYYSVDVSAGEVFGWVSADNYYGRWGPEHTVGEGQTVNIDFYLYKRIPDSATLCGYVTDETTGDPIENILMQVYSDNEELHHFGWNFTFTDSNGFYETHMPESTLQISPESYWHAMAWSEHYTISNGETYWYNTTLYEIPDQTSVLCGYITDEVTQEPIEDAYVSLYWDDDKGHHYHKYGETDETGFYKIYIAAGEISLYAYENDRFSTEIDGFPIGQDETIWLDIVLEPHPTATSVVKGNILSETAINTRPIKGTSPIKGAQVVVRWDDGERSYSNYDMTDSSGNYEIDIAAGEVYVRVYADGHKMFYTEPFMIEEGEAKTVDVTLEPVKMNISVIKPTKGLYINNNLVFNLFITIILGNIDIEVVGNENLYEVQFFIDNEFRRAIPSFDPFVYPWEDGSSGKHTIKLVFFGAYDSYNTKTISVWKVF